MFYKDFRNLQLALSFTRKELGEYDIGVMGEIDVETQLGVMLGLGFTKEDAAKSVSTSEFPAGMSVRSVFNKVNASDGRIEALAKFVAAAKRERATEIKEIRLGNVRQELETMLGDAVATIREALKNGDVKAAESLLDRLMGKATQTNLNLVAGRIDVQHHQMPAEVASAMDKLIASGQVPLALPEAQEAEVLGEN